MEQLDSRYDKIKNIRLVRHAESAANAGQATQDHASIPLTPRGLKQAIEVAKSFSKAPQLIVASPFDKAQATAKITAAAFSQAKFETWPVQEFTYLEPARCVDTTVTQRKSWVDAYWLRSDPAFCDGVGAESFSAFVARAQSFLVYIEAHETQDIVVFSHGQFMNAVAWLLERKLNVLDGRAMVDWRRYEIENNIQNCCGFSLCRKANDVVWTLGQRLSLGDFR
ncbi:broad specificity phosphatase PhoE [Pseudomonas sp. BP8]|nr:histidine phosphatase family protein [Pseudomonas sp. BP8]MBP2262294.1 broad specificity phosphatase PhoE [Pseudomonas sp. BP8]